jgi:flagellar biosynthesis protein FlhB
MNQLLTFLLRVLLIAAGLIFAASLLVVMLFLLVIWTLRALWFKLTGRAVAPFVMRINPRAGFEQVFRRAERGPVASRAPRREIGDVTDVEPKQGG